LFTVRKLAYPICPFIQNSKERARAGDSETRHWAWGMGHWAWGMGHGAWGIGHGAWGIGHRAWGMGYWAWGMGHRA